MYRVIVCPLIKAGEIIMTIENGVQVLATSMVLLSVLFSNFVHPGFIWLTVFVGLNLLQSAFTGFCPAASILKKMGLK